MKTSNNLNKKPESLKSILAQMLSLTPFYGGAYCDLTQENLQKWLLSPILLREHILLRIYPKFPQTVYRTTY